MTAMEKISAYFLAPYADSRLEVRKKVGILWKLTSVIAVAILLSAVGNNLVFGRNVFSATLEIAMSALLILTLHLLRRGRYETASNLAILVPLIGLGIAGFRGYSGEPMLDLSLLALNLVGIVFYACLVGYRLFQPLAVAAFSCAVVAAQFQLVLVPALGAHRAAAAHPVLINDLLVLIVSGFIAMFVFRIHREIVAVAEAEARSNAEKAEQLRQAEARLLVTLRSIGEGVIATDVQGRVTLMNGIAEQLTGHTMEESAGHPLAEIYRTVHDLTGERCENPVEKILNTGEIQGPAGHRLLRARDGSKRPVSSCAAPIRDLEGRIVGVVMVFRDIAERQRMEEGLRNAQRLESVGVLAGGIAHDFNNLLSGLFGYIELARGAAGASPEAAAWLEKALNVFGRAKGLTQQLLTFSKGGQPVKQLCALGPVLRNSAHFVLTGSTVGAEFRIPADLWPCEVDENQIGQVVDNLVLNARQAMPAGGSIRIAARNLPEGTALPPLLAPGPYVLVEVRDEGIGIPREDLSRIFDPFFTTKKKGSGLGLTVAYSILKKHGGFIEADSEPDKGTTFRIYLPAVPDATCAPAVVPAEAAAPRGARVLVLDDEPCVRDINRRCLEQAGYRVECAGSGEQALVVFERALREGPRFDAVILDLTIPGGMGGEQAMARMREFDPAVRGIATSGYSDDPVMAEPERFGFKGRLAKPHTQLEMRRVLQQVLRPEE